MLVRCGGARTILAWMVGSCSVTSLGTLMEPRNLLRSFDLAARAAGIKPAKDPKAPRGTKTGVDFHGLRHDFAGLLGELGVPLHVVRSMIGHSEDAMTARHRRFRAGRSLIRPGAMPTRPPARVPEMCGGRCSGP
jgi:integrase